MKQFTDNIWLDAVKFDFYQNFGGYKNQQDIQEARNINI